MIDNITVWLNTKRTKAMILDGKRMFLGHITKKQADELLRVVPEDCFVFHTGNVYFEETYPKYTTPRASLKDMLYS